jgi:hypothetical protein
MSWRYKLYICLLVIILIISAIMILFWNMYKCYKLYELTNLSAGGFNSWGNCKEGAWWVRAHAGCFFLPHFGFNFEVLDRFFGCTLGWVLVLIAWLTCLLVYQMTDARCSRCSEFKVRLRDVIQAGHGARYQVFFTPEPFFLLAIIF